MKKIDAEQQESSENIGTGSERTGSCLYGTDDREVADVRSGPALAFPHMGPPGLFCDICAEERRYMLKAPGGKWVCRACDTTLRGKCEFCGLNACRGECTYHVRFGQQLLEAARQAVRRLYSPPTVFRWCQQRINAPHLICSPLSAQESSRCDGRACR